MGVAFHELCVNLVLFQNAHNFRLKVLSGGIQYFTWKIQAKTVTTQKCFLIA